MNATPTSVATMPVEADVPEQQNNVQYVSRDIFKQIKKQQQHLSRQQKIREQRWAQPNANAKIEDIELVYKNLLGQVEVLKRAMLMRGLLTTADIDAAVKFQNERIDTLTRINYATDMSVEEKKTLAAQFDIPLTAIGLTEEPNTNGEEHISESPEQTQ